MLYPGKKLARIQVESCPIESHSGFQVTGMIKGLLNGFEIFDSRIFFSRKFCQVFVGWLDLRRDCFGYSKQSEDWW